MGKHVRIYNTEFHPKMGGIITHMQDVSDVLISHGFQADIVCDQCVASPNANAPVIRIPEFVSNGIVEKVFYPKYHVRHLSQYLPDASHVDVHWVREAHYALAVLEKYGPEKMLYIMPTVLPRMLDYAKNWGFKNRLRSLAWRFQISRIEAEVVAQCRVAVSSQARKDEVVEFYGADASRVHVVPIGIDASRFLSKGSRKNDVLTGLTVARLSPEKGIESLLEALAQIQDQNWQWVIVGDGWMRSNLERTRAKLGLDERVKFVGAVASAAYYGESDLFVLPSHYEGFGLVLLEAMVNRLPCIAFDTKPPEVVTASKEIIEHEKTGFVVEAKNTKEMAECIKRLLNDAGLRAYMGELGYQRSIAQFTWKDCVERYLNINGHSLAGDV